MDNQSLAQFIEWLPSNIEELKDKSTEEIVDTLNKMSQSKEGMDKVSKWVDQFKESFKMYKKGGKIEALINKFQNGGKSRINPNDEKVIIKALKNHSGDRNTPYDTYTTTGLVRDSLIKVGYNPSLVRKLAKPMIDSAEQRIIKEDPPAPEDNTTRQFNLLKFLKPHIYSWKKGTADTNPEDTLKREILSIINDDGVSKTGTAFTSIKGTTYKTPKKPEWNDRLRAMFANKKFTVK